MIKNQNEPRRFRGLRAICGLSLSLGLILTGCGEAGTAEFSASESETTGPTSGTKIATLELGEAHYLQFAEYEDGAIAVAETGPLGEDSVALLGDPDVLKLDPLELYLAVTPEDRAVPEALLHGERPQKALDAATARGVTLEPMGLLPAQWTQLRKRHDPVVVFKPELCQPTGAFRDQICDPNSGLDETYCHSTLSPHGYSNGDSGKHRNVAAIAIGCNAGVQIKLRTKIGAWYSETFDLPLAGHYMIAHVSHSFSYHREAHTDPILPVSTTYVGVRAFHAFW